jgi:hypothetical protein
VNCRNLLPNILRGHITSGFIAIAPTIIAFVALTVAAPVFAQSSLESSSAPITEYALPPPGGSLIEPAPRDDAILEDATPSAETSATSRAAVPTTPGAAVKPVTAPDNDSDVSPAAHSGWDRVGDVYTDTNSEDQADKVLEVPQVLPPANQQPDDADQTAQDGEGRMPDQVGSIDDYQDEEDSAVMGAYGVPVLLGPARINPFGVSAFRSIQAPLNRSFGPRFVSGFVPTVPRPAAGGMNSAILPTSPMFPRGPMRFSGGMYGRH